MASLVAVANSYRMKRAQVTKLRRKDQSKLKEILSQKRRSSSGLASLERKREATSRHRDHITQLLNQALAQRDSLGRLKTAAEERLRQEQDAKDQLKQQSDYGGPDEKAAAVERLKLIDDEISELRAEIKEREAAETRLVNTIENYQREKAKLDQKLRKEIHAKPALIEQLKTSTKAESTLRPRVLSLVKREAQVGKTLVLMQKKLAQLAEKRRKTKRKAKKKAKTKVRKAKHKIVKRKTRTRTRKASRRKKTTKRRTVTKRMARTRTRKPRRVTKRKTKRKKLKSRQRK